MLSLFILSLIKGKGDGSMAGVVKCSHVDWVLFALLIVIAAILTVIGILMLIKEHKVKEEIGYPFVEGDLKC